MHPATLTKHLPNLRCSFAGLNLELSQSDDGKSNGSALWLGAQIIACHLKASSFKLANKNVCELGSGIGFTACVAASLGYNVLATDLPFIVDSLLATNVARNIPALPQSHGSITVFPVDWLRPIQWDAPELSHAQPPFSLILSSDTIYTPSLTEPLLNTIHHLCTISASAKPIVLLCIERRDKQVVDQFFVLAAERNFRCDRVRQKHLVQSMEKVLGKEKMWSPEDYEGMELWKMKLIG